MPIAVLPADWPALGQFAESGGTCRLRIRLPGGLANPYWASLRPGLSRPTWSPTVSPCCRGLVSHVCHGRRGPSQLVLCLGRLSQPAGGIQA